MLDFPDNPPTDKISLMTTAKKLAQDSEMFPPFIVVGTVERKIDVQISYKIIELFSEGLYSSANKAFEELVTNSFDAGASRAVVLLPPAMDAQGATIAVVDDGEGMNAVGLEQLWRIGVSRKRQYEVPPHGRKQIGKFGIGKLATYVLANRLTYVCKSAAGYFATTMDFTVVERGNGDGVAPSKPVQLDVRQLSVSEAEAALEAWTGKPSFQSSDLALFGPSAPPSWTVAILSSLKEKAKEIQPGRLGWILQTALPLRDDFAVYLGGKRLGSSKASKGRIGRWVLGEHIATLGRPSTGLSVDLDLDKPASDPDHFGLHDPVLGRVTGYAEAFKEVLTTGKSKELGRSNGFFVYVLGRLINIDDEYFGLDSNKLQHGAFSRFRLVVHIDRLDEELRSTRETVRDGPLSTAAKNLLNAVFNFVRPKFAEHDQAQSASARLSEKIAGSPASISRRPLVELFRKALKGDVRPRYLQIPSVASPKEGQDLLKEFQQRAEQPDGFIGGVEFSYDLSDDAGIAVFDGQTNFLRVNGLHPFAAAFSDIYQNPKRSLPLEILAFAEVLLEAQLYHLGHKTTAVDAITKERDELLRFLAKSSGRRTALTVSQDLQDARNNSDRLEEQVVAAFDMLGFESRKIGGSGKPDGVAIAHLAADDDGPRRYQVSLEAKSKVTDGAKVTAKAVGISAVARQRDEFECEHAVVVGPDFPTSAKERSALGIEIQSESEKFQALPERKRKTITLLRIDDLAKLVRLAVVRHVRPSKIRELLQTCSLPEEATEWVETVTSIRPEPEPYRDVLETIWSEQIKDTDVQVEYTALRVQLRDRADPIKRTNEELLELCRGMATMAPGLIIAREKTVELETPPERILEAIEDAVQDLPPEER